MGEQLDRRHDFGVKLRSCAARSYFILNILSTTRLPVSSHIASLVSWKWSRARGWKEIQRNIWWYSPKSSCTLEWQSKAAIIINHQKWNDVETLKGTNREIEENGNGEDNANFGDLSNFEHHSHIEINMNDYIWTSPVLSTHKYQYRNENWTLCSKEVWMMRNWQ